MQVQTHTSHLPGRCHPDLSRLPSHVSAWVLSSSLSMGAGWPGREESTYSLPRALQSDGWDVPSERWDLPSWPREELTWGQRSYISTETAKQTPAQAWQHIPLGGTSHSALDAGASFSLQGGDMDCDQPSRGERCPGQEHKPQAPVPRHKNSPFSGSHRALALHPC